MLVADQIIFRLCLAIPVEFCHTIKFDKNEYNQEMSVKRCYVCLWMSLLPVHIDWKNKQSHIYIASLLLFDNMHAWITIWIVPQSFKLLPIRHIFFDLVIRLITNRKYAFFCIFKVRLSADNINRIYWIKVDHVQL